MLPRISENTTHLAGLTGSFPPSTMKVYVSPRSTMISGISKPLMYHAMPQEGVPKLQ